MRTLHSVKYLDGLLINNIIQDFQKVCLAVKPQYQVPFVIIVQNIVIFRIIQHMVYVLSGDPVLEGGWHKLDNDFHASILSQNHRGGKCYRLEKLLDILQRGLKIPPPDQTAF
jgi:hypothetical protein